MRDCFSSFTTAAFIKSESANDLRNGLFETSAHVLSGDGATVRVDCATAFQTLVGDPQLKNYGITLELGRTKNRNKNPVAEKAIGELEEELCRTKPGGQPVTSTDLILAIRTLNSRIRNRGLAAYEILYKRDHLTGSPLDLDDNTLANRQQDIRLSNHAPSAKSKCPRGKIPTPYDANIGDLVFVKSDKTKHQARDSYIVVGKNDEFIQLRKFTGSGFRSKLYDVKPSEIYPCPNGSARLPSSPVRTGERYNCDPDSSSSDEDVVPHDNVNNDNDIDNYQDNSESSSDDNLTEDNHEVINQPPRRGDRIRRPPPRDLASGFMVMIMI